VKKERRDKLTDLIRESEPALSRKVSSFKEAYPSIAKLNARVTEKGMRADTPIREWHFTEENFEHAVDCSNPNCYGGGIELGLIINEMVSRKEKEREGTELCKGREGSAKGRNLVRSCPKIFKVVVQIEYVNEA
jgi:hypothetical protein